MRQFGCCRGLDREDGSGVIKMGMDFPPGGRRESTAPNTGRVVPKTGDLFERTFQTHKGPVDLLAETVVEGETLILKDVVVYGRSPSNLTGLTKEA
jgi:hypothetical protein